MTEKIKIIVSIISLALPLLSTILTLIIKNVKNVKSKKIAEQINFYTDKAKEYVAKAEDFLNYKGLEKKEFVITKINQECLESKVKFDLEKVSDIIEKIVLLTKKVNKREKDKGGELK